MRPMLHVASALCVVVAAALHCSVTEGFAPNVLTTPRRLPKTSNVPPKIVATTSTTLFENKLWDRMEIEEDEEPFWYCLNCVAGLEMDLLRQCRQRCADMEDVEKFVVPMVTNVRSHGANRMVKDTKVKYQGYVFAKLRLCPETYEAIQGLDLCRSWMGTINFKGSRKLPPAPVCLNDDEIEKFGLEECEAEEPEEPEDEDDIIVDNQEDDEEAAELEETVQKVYKGLRVEDMVKVTAKNKFFNEDAVVRRLKDGKLFLRFYTYGTMYEEWMDPGDVRKLTGEEILRGLSGPQQPITQRDIDGPSQGDRRRRFDDDQSPGELRRNLVGSFGGGPRNRRQDRIANQYQRDSDRNDGRNDDNWNWYKDNERRGQQGGYGDGDIEIRGSQRRTRGRNDDWAGGDVDSQWGRTSQRQNRREKRTRDSNDGGDWSAFVSPAKERPSKEETDDFFASLMTDLSNDLDSESSPGGGNSNPGDDAASSGEDDFFASLISEIEDEAPTASPKKKSFDDGDDDFFASLVDEVQDDIPSQKQSKSTGGDDSGDDFFASLVDEIQDDSPPAKQSKPSTGGDEDFFASLIQEIGADDEASEDSSSKSNKADELDDFFSDLGAFDDESADSGAASSDSGSEDFFPPWKRI